jgi:tRNA pseudouridine55 synthase
MLNSSDGIILVDKNEGETSFDVVRRAKRAFKRKKVGHAGTLDPFATGLLIILLGQGTKLSDYLMSGEKRYLATMTLGITTDTLDRTGRITKIMAVPDVDQKTIGHAVQAFTGNIEQKPPAYSAININGRRAYDLARQGIEVDLKKRTVNVRSIDVISVSLPDVTFEVKCSSGTYVRTLAADIAEKLGSAGHLKSLRRLSSGGFNVSDALDSRMLEIGIEDCDLAERVIILKDALHDMQECSIDHETARRIINGLVPDRDSLSIPNDYQGFVKMVNESSLIAIMEVAPMSKNNKAWLKKIRVFA